ncbi:MAG: D-glycero-beta-D-manno-heptose-7-phosphate kinase [Alphaproteobacteria bacterium]|nr:D-glycero-beta-D-manno-heptose-7-phosphate kinase [Alphaproteobacteria bacterium]
MNDKSDTGTATGLDALKGARVACVGDIMLDRFIHGTVERISPEAPIPILRIGGQTAMLGGVGNVLRNLTALDSVAMMVAVTGQDAEGDEVARLAQAEGGATAHLIRDPARPTSVKSRYVAGGQQLLRTDAEDNSTVSGAVEVELIAALEKTIADAHAVVISDYGKGVLTDRVVAGIFAAAAANNIPVVVDPAGRNYERYRGANLLTPNRKELAEASALTTGTEAEIDAAARHIIETCGIGAVLATRGPEGMTLVSGADAPVTLPARTREVFDVSGAGDTVVAAVAAGLAGGLALVDAIELANAAAGVVVGKVGTATATPREILEQMTLVSVRDQSAKIKTDAGLDEQIAQWRRQGYRIGFTNGCFDVIHPGHVSLLEQAAATCDRLVVALNADASVSALKGAGRPVQDENARARVIASLADVDAVVLFAEDTPEALIRRIRPDTLVKGADYTVETVVGADFVQSYGGEVVLAKLEPGHSTSAAIARMVT